MSLCVINGTDPTIVLPADQYRGKTVGDIIKDAKLGDCLLGLRTPYVTDVLENTDIPTEKCQELIIQGDIPKYPPPTYYLKVLPKSDSKTIWIEVKVQTQLKDVFPTMPVAFQLDELPSQTAADILMCCKSVFGYECSDANLIMSETLVNLDDPAEPLIEKSRNDHLVFNCTVSDAGRKKIMCRGHLVYEIIHTEETYINDLQTLTDYFEPKLREKKIFEENEIHSLFRDIFNIKKVHQEFLVELQKITPSYAAVMSGVFLCHLQNFTKATPFVSSYKRFDDMIKEKRTSSRSVEKTIKEIEHNMPGFVGRDFMSYYITPVQRYPRYPLLFRDLDKNTPSFHPDKPYLAMTVLKLNSVNKAIDSISHRVSQMTQMNAIQELMPEGFTILDHGREIIETASVRIVGKKSGPGALYLFNDLIMLCAAKKKLHTPLFNKKPLDFSFANGKPAVNSLFVPLASDAFQLDFASADDKSTWMDAYTQLMGELLAADAARMGNWLPVELTEGLPDMTAHDGCVSNGAAWFFGGTNESLQPLNLMVRFNIGDSLWSVERTEVPPRMAHSLVSVHGDLFVAFGVNKKPLADIWRYNTATRKWTQAQVSGNPSPRYQHSAVVHNGRVVFYGGYRANNDFNDTVAVFDPHDGSYTEYSKLPGAPPPRAGHAAVLVGKNRMAVIGGRTAQGPTGEVWVLNLNKMVWTKRRMANVSPRQDFRACVLEGRFIFVAGGLVTQQGSEMCVIDTKSWTLISFGARGCAPPALCKQAVVALDAHRLLTFGGMDRANRRNYPSAWILDVGACVGQLASASPSSPDKYWLREESPQSSTSASAAPRQVRASTIAIQQPHSDAPPPPMFDDQELKRVIERRHSMNMFNIASSAKEKAQASVTAPPPPPQEKAPLSMPAPPPLEKAPIAIAPPQPPKETVKEKEKEKEKEKKKSGGFAGFFGFGDDSSSKDKKKPVAPVKEKKEIPQNTNTNNNVGLERGAETSSSQGGMAVLTPDILRGMRGNLKKGRQTLPPGSLQEAVQQPAEKRVMTAPGAKLSPAGVVQIHTGPKFDREEALRLLGIDITRVPPLQQRAATIKVQRLWQRQVDNDELGAKVERFSQLLKGNCDPPPGTPVLLKVFDDSTRSTRLAKIDSSMTVEQLGQLAQRVLNKQAILTVNVGSGVTSELNPDSLRAALRLVYKGEMRCLTICAL